MKLSTLDQVSCFLAELIGTALLIFLGCMGCIEIEGIPNSHLQQVLNFGLVIMIIIQIFGCVSGAHLNPAVTIAAYIYNIVSLATVGIYFIAQIIGAFIGFGLLKALVSSQALMTAEGAAGFCTTVPHAKISVFQAFCIEFIITGVLIFVCCACWDPRNEMNTDSLPLKFGLTITCIACCAGPWTGASMNPARSFGPATWTNDFTHHWIYWIAPISSAIISSIAYKSVFRQRDIQQEKPKSIEEMTSLS